jgi:hypothetical protein
VQFTGRGAEERLQGRVAGGPLANLVEARRARFSLEDLERRQETSRARSRAAGVPFNSDIDVPANRVELHVTEPEKLQAKLAAAGAHLPEGVAVKRVSRLAQSEALTGGVALSTCTSGFTVRNNSTGEQVTNQFDSGIGIRSVVGTIPRDNQAIGSVVCKNGMTTGHTCGTISSKTFDLGANHNATFIRMNNYPSANLSEGETAAGRGSSTTTRTARTSARREMTPTTRSTWPSTTSPAWASPS